MKRHKISEELKHLARHKRSLIDYESALSGRSAAKTEGFYLYRKGVMKRHQISKELKHLARHKQSLSD